MILGALGTVVRSMVFPALCSVSHLTSVCAMASLCLWPTESCLPPLPTSVSYPAGSEATQVWRLALLAASITWSMVAVPARSPYRMLSAMVLLNSTGSWLTSPSLFLSQGTFTASMLAFSSLMSPLSRLCSLWIS